MRSWDATYMTTQKHIISITISPWTYCGSIIANTKVCLCELHFSHIKTSNSVDCIAFVDNCWGFSLGSTEDYVCKVFSSGYPCDFLEIVLHHVWIFKQKLHQHKSLYQKSTEYLFLGIYCFEFWVISVFTRPMPYGFWVKFNKIIVFI